MSRSHRRIPIFGTATCRSERNDKQRWHRRWRSRERVALTDKSEEALNAHLRLLERQISNVWSMGKDGRSYQLLRRQAVTAIRVAHHEACHARDRDFMAKRVLREWLSK